MKIIWIFIIVLLSSAIATIAHERDMLREFKKKGTLEYTWWTIKLENGKLMNK